MSATRHPAVQCFSCENFKPSRVTGTACSLKPVVRFAELLVAGCPIDKFGPSPLAVMPSTPTPVAADVLNERKAVCEGCPIGGFEGWEDESRAVARCRHCEACKKKGRAVGLIQLTHFKCPRGHHEE